MQITNQQRPITFTLAAGVESWIVGTVDKSVQTQFPLNGGSQFALNVDCSAIVGVTTVFIYAIPTVASTPAALGSFALPGGKANTVISFPSFGPLSLYAVEITAKNAAGGVIVVDARVTG